MTDTMTDTTTKNDAPVPKRRPPAGRGGGPDGPKGGGPRAPRVHPALQQLAQLYPHLFGETFRPLKRGIFQELMSVHEGVFERDALKQALALHTRSTRYLTVVASGQPRYDLQGQEVESMAPEHVYLALIEVFRRRQARAGEDLRPRLRERIVQAFDASGLARSAYAELVRSQRDEAANALLDEAMAEAASRSARDEALLRAYEASGKSVEEFAGMYGIEAPAASRMLERARRGIAAQAAPAADSAPSDPPA
ncbi:MAG: ProQ/FINO family protein [Ramlibacter sp.]